MKASRLTRALILKQVAVTRIFSAAADGKQRDGPVGIFSCWTFWFCYLILGIRPSRFVTNHVAAWRQKYPDYEVALFVDRKTPVLKIPCAAPDALDDATLFRHFHYFHNLMKIASGSVSALLPKSPLRVEIIKVRPSQEAWALDIFAASTPMFGNDEPQLNDDRFPGSY